MKDKLLLIGLSLMIIGCNKHSSEKSSLPRASTQRVVTSTIPIQLKAIGHCKAFRSAAIKAQVEGYLQRVHYREGSFVKEGDLLLTIDPSSYMAALDQALATRAENIAKLKYSAEVVARYKNLLEEDYVSQLEYDGFVKNLEENEATVMQNDASIRLAQINLEYCFIRAPFSGLIGKKLIDEGNLITNDGSTMVVINQVDPIYIDFSLPEKDFKTIMKYKKGSPELEVDIKLPEELEPFKARLIVVDNTIDSNTGMVPLRAQIKNSENSFWPGQYVEASLIVTYEENAILVPSKAIITGSKGQYVYVVNSQSKAKYVPVQGFEVFGEYTHVKADLKNGDRVITRGQINIKPNDKVQVINSEMSE